MGLRETLALKETLEAATPGPWRISKRPKDANYLPIVDDDRGLVVMPHARDAALIALAPELAAEVLELRERHREAMALVLDMGEELRRSLPQDESMDHGRDPDRRALLARLDQLGKEPGG